MDGALFAFVVSNDPELFLMLEAVTDVKEGKWHWNYSLVRMSSLKETVRLHEKEVWSVPNFYNVSPKDRPAEPYFEAKTGTFKPAADTALE